MKALKEYEIKVYGLKVAKHTFTYQIGDSFFQLFDFDGFESGKFEVVLELDKKENLLQLDFHIKGEMELECDRSLEHFSYPVDFQKQLIIKYGETAQEIDDDLEMIAFGTQEINVARYIYEYIAVSVPLKKVHPDYEDEDVNWIDEPDDDEADSPEDVDPRWKELLKLKNKTN